MSFELRGEAAVAALDVEELKLVFRVLHRSLAANPDLMDTHFLTELQRFLHGLATRAGVDIADHGAWDRWLSSPGRRAGAAALRPDADRAG
ncbi:MAG: hypothetical protein U1A27_13275 [Phycisphaerae bacterium]